MSRYSVNVELRHKKFTPISITEEYSDKDKAKLAYSHWSDLCEFPSSCIWKVTLVRHTEEEVVQVTEKVGAPPASSGQLPSDYGSTESAAGVILMTGGDRAHG